MGKFVLEEWLHHLEEYKVLVTIFIDHNNPKYLLADGKNHIADILFMSFDLSNVLLEHRAYSILTTATDILTEAPSRGSLCISLNLHWKVLSWAHYYQDILVLSTPENNLY